MKFPTVPILKDSKPGYDEKLKIWSGRPMHPFFHKDVSIGRAGLFMLEANPHKIIQICATTGKQLTCKQLTQMSVRVAQHFKSNLCLQQEDVVGLVVCNSTYVTPIVMGTFLLGGAISPMYTKFDETVIRAMFNLTKPKVIFCDVEVYDKLMQSLNEIDLKPKVYTLKGRINGVSYVEDLFEELNDDETFTPAELKHGGDQTAAIVCSSGTTGIPKGVCLSHHQLLSRNDLCYMKSDDVLFTFSTLHWITGILLTIQSLVGGQKLVITELPFTAELFLEIIEKQRITQILIPPAYAALTSQCPDIVWRDVSCIRNIIIGGAPMSMNACKRLSQYLKNTAIGEAYGLSELAGLTNINWEPLKKKQSVGRLNPNLKAKIVSDDGEQQRVGEIGEIYIWQPAKWVGYLGNRAMTNQTIDKNGWIKTGDMGYFDKDDCLYICGRQKDILRHRHFLIHPREIEEVIQQIPGVLETCVFGIPDQLEEDRPSAAIVKSPDSSLISADICQVVAKSLPERMHLTGGVYFLQELPKTSTGKIQRSKMLAIVEELIK